MSEPDERLLRDLWRALGGRAPDADAVRLEGPPPALPSTFQVGALASASIGAATLAAAELWAFRRGDGLRACSVSRRHAGAAFRCERLSEPEGWTLPPVWDPFAGDYQTRDGWVRLHTNYTWHRDAALGALHVAPDKAALAAAVRERTAEEVESAVVGAGGCAAALRSREAWASHPQGRAVAEEALIAGSGRRPGELPRAAAEAPLSGLRVLDLTRVIAGPVCTRFLAAHGADVLRVDPPEFDEVGALLPETTRGKRCAFLALDSSEGRAVFDGLIAHADVLVHGHRFGTLERLGYTPERLSELNPNLVTTRVDAYGFTGPWSSRRGFDSLVQMSTGIAHGGTAGKPSPLPAQALDHATGYLLAAATCRALVDGRAESRLSLARVAKLLVDLGTGGGTSRTDDDSSEFLERVDTEWGKMGVVRIPGSIGGSSSVALMAPGPLGRHAPRFQAVD
jgi:hypothetical protein